jgi:hypothetical protein
VRFTVFSASYEPEQHQVRYRSSLSAWRYKTITILREVSPHDILRFNPNTPSNALPNNQTLAGRGT